MRYWTQSNPPGRAAQHGQKGFVVTPRTLSLHHWIMSGAFALLLAVAAMPAVAENTATKPESRDNPNWIKRHQSMADRLKEGHARVLWIGDSIVQRWEGPGRTIWNKYYGHRDAVNLGISGDRTQHVLWRLDHCNLDCVSPKLAIVMIGQNNGPDNTAEEIAEGNAAIVSLLRQKQPNMKILLLAITFRGEYPNDEQIKLAKANDILAKMDDGRHVFYMNINKIFLRPDGTIPKSLMPDCEHPNKEGCRLWAEAVEPKVAELLGEKPIKPDGAAEHGRPTCNFRHR
jgi:beta-glucosidase